jgi:uncharacterized protein Yka (UPF0111/DUF47 family)
MSCLNPWYRARIIAKIVKKEALLEKAYETYEELLSSDIHSYRFDSNEGHQRAESKRLSELKEQIDSLEAEIDYLYRQLTCSGLTSINVRRKHGRYGRLGIGTRYQ